MTDVGRDGVDDYPTEVEESTKGGAEEVPIAEDSQAANPL